MVPAENGLVRIVLLQEITEITEWERSGLRLLRFLLSSVRASPRRYHGRKVRADRPRTANPVHEIKHEDKIKGSLLEAKGKVKEESGKAVGSEDLRDRGTGEKVAGKVQKKIGDVKKVFGK